MSFTRVDGTLLHHRFRPGRGTAVVLLNSLGTDGRIWDAVIDALPADVPVLRTDKRGHGLSSLSGSAPASIERLAEDVAALMEVRALDGALVCGVSIGGLIAQALALAHPARVSALVLSNTAARIGDAAGWQARLDALERDGLAAMADAVIERWFSPTFRQREPDALEGFRTLLLRTPEAGYAAACRAILDADLRERVGAVRVPTVCIAGELDLATPPSVVLDLASRIPGARYVQIDGVAHLPCIEVPEIVAGHILSLLRHIEDDGPTRPDRGDGIDDPDAGT